MKMQFLILMLFSSLAGSSQSKHSYYSSMLTGTDFGAPYTMIGLETGFYGESSRHSYLFTLEAERLDNQTLIRNGRGYMVWKDSPFRSSHVTTLKYAYRGFRSGIFELHAVVQPWRSWNMDLTSVYGGGRITLNFKDYLHTAEFVADPFVKRYGIRYVFTPKLKNISTQKTIRQ